MKSHKMENVPKTHATLEILYIDFTANNLGFFNYKSTPFQSGKQVHGKQ